MLAFYNFDEPMGYARHKADGWKFDRCLPLDNIVEDIHNGITVEENGKPLMLSLQSSKQDLENWLPNVYRSITFMCVVVPDDTDTSDATLAPPSEMTDAEYNVLLSPPDPKAGEKRRARLAKAVKKWRKTHPLPPGEE